MKGFKLVAVLVVWLALGLVATFIGNYFPAGHGGNAEATTTQGGE
ncbi:MAG: hypothetical protein ACYCX4_02525 [Bacillota bacterium]